MSAIGRDIARSLRREPDQWEFKVVSIRRRCDGLEVTVIKPFEGSRYARIEDEKRGNPELGWWDRWRIHRAFRAWQRRKY